MIVLENSELPSSDKPYRFAFFRGMMCAVNVEHGCFVYDDQQWKKCHPESNDLLVYDPRNYYRA